MAIEINEEGGVKRKRSFLVLFVLFFVLAIFSGAYGYIYFSSKNLEEKIKEKDLEIKKISEERKDIEKKIIEYSQNISDFKKVFNERKDARRIFSLIENISHPYVWFSSFNLNTELGDVNLSGNARDFTSLGQQIIILKNMPNLRNLNISGIQANEDSVSFSLFFNIDVQTLE